jgi:hypothetical protein
VRLKPAAFRPVFSRVTLSRRLGRTQGIERADCHCSGNKPTDFGETCGLHYPGEVLGVGAHIYALARSDVVKMGSIAGNLDSYASSTWMTKNSRNSRL